MQGRDDRLDFLKAISILFVLFWHFKPLCIIPSSCFLSKILFHLIRAFNFEITLLAVPTFFLVSLFLFQFKILENQSYLKLRISHLLKIFIFWSAVRLLTHYMIVILTAMNNGSMPNFRISIWYFLIGLEPSLPRVGLSVLYFLVDMMVLSVIFFIFLKLNQKTKFYLSIVTIILSIIYFEVSIFTKNIILHWGIDNFIIYIAYVYIITIDLSKQLSIRYYCLVALIIFMIRDILLQYFYHIPILLYGRTSIFLGTITFFSFVYSNHNLKINKYLRLLSKYSLGIFVTHLYWQFIFILLTSKTLDLFHANNVIEIVPDLFIRVDNLIIASLSFTFTFLFIFLLSMTRLKKFIC